MIIFKKKFKNLIKNNRLSFLKKYGHKIYFNIYNDILFKRFYKYIKYILGYKYIIKLIKFNIIQIVLFIFDVKNKGYVKIIKHINLFNIKNFNNK